MKDQIGLFKQAFAEFGEDKAQRLAASLAYYTLFSIAPLLLIAIAIAGLVFGKSQAQAQIVGEMRTLFGTAGAKAIEEMLTSAAKPKSGTFAIVFGFVTLLFGAAGVFGQLKDALNTIWNVEEKKKGGILTLLRQRFLSFAMVFGAGFLLLVSLVIDAAVSAMGKFASNHLPGGEALWQVLQIAASFVVVSLLFAMIFRFLPDVRIEWHDVRFGATFTALLFVAGKFALGLWLGRGSVGSAYGAAGSLVVLLLWIYWSANIVFFGAEFTQVYARTHGSKKVENRLQPVDGERPKPVPHAPVLQPKPSKVPVFAGGAFGLVLGALLGGVSASILFLKSIKKILT